MKIVAQTEQRLSAKMGLVSKLQIIPPSADELAPKVTLKIEILLLSNHMFRDFQLFLWGLEGGGAGHSLHFT